MAKIERFEDLEIWRRATDIAVTVYGLSNRGLLKSDFSARDQVRRAAISISSNIAEGFEYNNNRDFIRFLRFAKGSGGELRSQLYILLRAGLISQPDYDQLHTQLLTISRQISNLIYYLKQKLNNPGEKEK